MEIKSITVTVTNRPQYLKEFLKTLQANSLEGYKIFFGVEPIASQEVCQLLENVSFIDKEIIYNPTKLGDQVNPYRLEEKAFNSSSCFNVHFDEDLILSPDAFNLLNWYYDSYSKNPMAYHHYSLFNYYSDVSYLEDIVDIDDFWGLGHVLFKENWDNIFSKYWFDSNFGGGWDWRFPGVMKFLGLKALMPKCSRLNHIGLHGVNTTQDWQDKAFTNLSWNKNKVCTTFRYTGSEFSKRMRGEALV